MIHFNCKVYRQTGKEFCLLFNKWGQVILLFLDLIILLMSRFEILDIEEGRQSYVGDTEESFFKILTFKL